MAGCDGLSHKVLTDTLRRAERDGLIARRLDPTLMKLVRTTPDVADLVQGAA